KDRTSGTPTFASDERPSAQSKKVGPGEKITLALPAGGNAVTGMMLSLKAADVNQSLRSCVVEGTFDGEQGVWCPAGDFFGTEDYYGYAWCYPEVFHRPFHAQTRCDGQEKQNNWGRTTLTRSRSLDAIPFTSALGMNIEVWHWKECDVEYATTAYFYATPGAT